jgi:menaquinone-dependent protoporphyrinogen oxidase
MRVLVVYGSKRGGTAELARMVGKAFAERGWSVEIQDAASVATIGDADAVVVGGALYMNRWHRDAVRFVKRHGDALRERPVWFFSSGPLDDSARSGDTAPVAQVNALASSIEIKGHMTFGGRLTSDAKGLIASRMAKQAAGDWRDPQHVREWVHQITHDTVITLPPETINLADRLPRPRGAAHDQAAARSTRD